MHPSICVATRSPPRAATRHLRRCAAIESIADGVPVVAGCVAAVGQGAAYLIADPQKRRDIQMEEAGGTEKDTVRDYFNGDGFDRWKRIYGTTEDVNKVQRDIREGHAMTIEKVLSWLTLEAGEIRGGCAIDEGDGWKGVCRG